MVRIGVQYLGLMAFFYLMPAFTNGIQGFFRGMGNMSITLISTLIQISVRVVFVSLLVPVMGLKGVAYASLIGWACMLLAEVPYYFGLRIEMNYYRRVTDDKEHSIRYGKSTG